MSPMFRERFRNVEQPQLFSPPPQITGVKQRKPAFGRCVARSNCEITPELYNTESAGGAWLGGRQKT
jgi:hypothetical protein